MTRVGVMERYSTYPLTLLTEMTFRHKSDDSGVKIDRVEINVSYYVVVPSRYRCRLSMYHACTPYSYCIRIHFR